MGQGSGRRSVIRPTDACGMAEKSWRWDYFHHQQQVARGALCLGYTGAAGAALRGLSPDDFLDPVVAGEYFEVLRDRSAGAGDVLAAIHRLISLPPALSRSEETGRFLPPD